MKRAWNVAGAGPRWLRATLGMSLATLAGACGPRQGEANPDSAPFSGASLTGASQSQAASFVAPEMSNGLELRTWVFQDSSARFAEAMSARADSWALDDARREALNRNGLRLVRIAPQQLDELASGLGGATVNLTAWHGQVLTWRTLVNRPLDSPQAPVAIDGRILPADAEAARLLMRGWTVALEDGPRFQLQLAPQLQRESEPAILPRQISGPRPGRSIASLRVDLLLEPGWAYLLTSEAPAVEWSFGQARSDPTASVEPNAISVSDDDAAVPPDPRPPQARPRSIERTPLGPDAEPAPTIGQLLFAGRHPSPTRGVFVFIPRLALSPTPDP